MHWMGRYVVEGAMVDVVDEYYVILVCSGNTSAFLQECEYVED